MPYSAFCRWLTIFLYMQTCISLGNEKSDLLLQIEKQLWRLLFQMAKGPCDLDALLRQLVYGIPWVALATASESDRQWFSLPTTSSQTAASSLHKIASSSSLPLPQQATPPNPSPAPSTVPPSPVPQAPMTQEGAQPDMDLSPDFEDPVQPSTQVIAPAPVSQDSGEQPMDTRLDFQDALAVNSGAVPEPDSDDGASTISLGDEEAPPYNYTSGMPDIDWNMGDTDEQNEEKGDEYNEQGSTEGMQDVDADMQDTDADGDEEGDGGVGEEEQQCNRGGVDEEEQQSNRAETLPPGGSSPEALVQFPRTSARLGDKKTEKPSSFPPPKAPSKRQRHPGAKHNKDMPDLEQVNDRALRLLLAAGNDYRAPIDVEALDMLMRNFPITEEHQVRFARVNSSKLHITIIWENRYSKRKFPYQVQANM